MKNPAAAARVAKPDSGPSFAVAFGGGGARGLAHIHVIEALDELGIRPTAIAGSSIGAIMGAGMAAGMTGKDIHAYAHSVLSRRAEVASRMWRARPGSIGEMVEGGFRVGQFNIERILKAFLPDAIPEDFAELKIPLKVTATDFFGHGLAVIESGDLYSALAASAAIPAVFRPVSRDGRLLIDGGIYNPVPFDLISRRGRHRHRHRRRRRAGRRQPQAADRHRAGVRRQPADDAVDHRHEAEAHAAGGVPAPAGLRLPRARFPEDRGGARRDRGAQGRAEAGDRRTP